MKPLLLNSVDNAGGAAKATKRLCAALVAAGIDARMLVQAKTGHESFVQGLSSGSKVASQYFKWHPHLDALPVIFYPERTRYIFSPAFLPQPLVAKVRALSPDIIHLNWVCEGFVRIETLPLLRAPLIWTLHDSWPFTGGCHLPFDCTRYKESCGRCPCLGSDKENDLSRWVWNRKRKVFPSLDLTVVAPSRAMAARAMVSSILKGKRVEVISNGIDTRLYRPSRKDDARDILGLPRNKKLVLFNALGGFNDGNKGFRYLHAALEGLRAQGLEVELLAVGADQLPSAFNSVPAHLLGTVEQEETMPLVYAAADVTAVPSLEESLSFTVMESMACGTPCVASDVGGIPDLIENGVNGYLCPPGDSEQLGGDIDHLLRDEALRAAFAAQGREKVERQFSIEVVSQRYLDLYTELLNARFPLGRAR